MKNGSFILWKKCNGLFGQPNSCFQMNSDAIYGSIFMGWNLHLLFLCRMAGAPFLGLQCWQSEQTLLKPFLAPGIGSEDGPGSPPSSRPGRGLASEGEAQC